MSATPPTHHALRLSRSLREILRVAVVCLDSLQVGRDSRLVGENIEAACAAVRGGSSGPGAPVSEATVRTRRLYKRLGLVPLRERPLPERLLREIRRGRPFPRTDDLADALRLVSLAHQFPIGCFDLDRLALPVEIGIGRPGEMLEGSRPAALLGRLILSDASGPFSDMDRPYARASAGGSTVRALVIAFAVADTPRIALEDVIRAIGEAAGEHCRGRVVETAILPER